MKLSRLSLVLIPVVLLGAIISVGCATAAAKEVEVKFFNHIQGQLPEQDVFIEAAGTPAGQVARVEGDAGKDPANLAKPAYAAAAVTTHDPFKMGPNPLGPFPKGKSLGFTLQQWLDATASGTYTVRGNSGEIKLSMQKLVPNGVYTLWCSRLTFPPNPKIVDTPCGKADGSQNSFKADSSGNATFTVKTNPLPDSTKETATVLALAYHSDGKTYGANPGEFGLYSHVQLAYLVPAPDDKAWMSK